MTDTIEGFSERVRRLRESLDLPLTQEDLGKKIGVRQSQIGNIERGGSLPSLPAFLRMVQALDTNADYLLGLTNDEKPASDLEDQVVVGVADERSRHVMQQIVDLVVALPYEEQSYAYGILRRLFWPRSTAQVLDELPRTIIAILSELEADPATAPLAARFWESVPPGMARLLRS